MFFCENDDNILYIKIDDDNSLVYHYKNHVVKNIRFQIWKKMKNLEIVSTNKITKLKIILIKHL